LRDGRRPIMVKIILTDKRDKKARVGNALHALVE
jgi:hypothetical protein